MSPPRAPQRASPHAPAPPRVYRRDVKKLTRVSHLGRTLHFTFRGGSGRGNSVHGFVKAEDVPPFEGDEAWFEMEMVAAKPWSFWRAVRQVEPPAHA